MKQEPERTAEQVSAVSAALAMGRKTTAEPAPSANDVQLTGIEIPFWDLVWFLIKLSVAAIPAGIVLFVLWSVVIGVLGNLLRFI